MRGKLDIFKGRLEEATGVLIASSRLRRQGKTDQAVGWVRHVAETTQRWSRRATGAGRRSVSGAE